MSARRSIAAAFVTMLVASGGGLALGSTPALAGKFELSSSFGGAGTGSGQFETPRGAAVEASTGDVFVVDSENKRVEKFNPEGTKVESIITGTGTPAPEFNEEPIGAAVDNSNGSSKGDVYVTVLDEGSGQFAVDKFEPKGTSGNEPNEYQYACQFTGPVRGCFKEPATEAPPGATFESGAGVAVDSSGNVYITAEDGVYEFEADGASLATPLHEFNFRPKGLAVSESGNDVYVVDPDSAAEFKYAVFKLAVNPATHEVEQESVLDTEEARAVSVDPGGNVYVVNAEGGSGSGPHVAKYNASGDVTGEFGAKEIGESVGFKPTGIAYSQFNKEVYVSDLENNDVRVFAEAPGPPIAATVAATEVTATSARLNGTVNPEGFATTSLFEYGPCTTPSTCATSLFASQATAWLLDSEPPSSEEGSGSVAVEVTARVAGLEPNQTYHYQLTATSTLPGSGSGGEQTFKTLAELPRVNDHPPEASSITRATAQLSGTLNPEHSETTYYFAYVDEAGYAPEAVDPYSAGTRTATVTAGEGVGDQTVTQPLVGLLPGTTYHYRLVATNQAGTVTGSDHSFTTAPPTPPLVTTGPPSGVTQTTATISGTVNPQGIQTSYELELGTDTSYSGAKIFGSAGQSASAETITVTLQDLAPGATYHYRIVATNADGTAYGADQSFTTPTISSPIVLPLTAPLLATPAATSPTESGTTTTTTTKALTRAQKLTKALKACRTKSKGKRAGCEKRARKQYTPVNAGVKNSTFAL